MIAGRPRARATPIGRGRTSIPNGPADDGNPFGMPEAEITLAVDVSALRRARSASRCVPTAARSPTPASSCRCPTRCSPARSAPSGSSRRAPSRAGPRRAGCSSDPPVPRPPRPRRRRLGHRPRSGLDELGQRQAAAVAARLAPLGPLPIVTSPLRRCRETAAPLAATCGTSSQSVEPAVAEIPSPEGVAMADRVDVAACGDGAARGPSSARATRRSATASSARCVALDGDTVVFSHFVAINAAIGAATRRRSARHPQPRQLLGHGGRRRRRRAPARRRWPRGRHADPLIGATACADFAP